MFVLLRILADSAPLSPVSPAGLPQPAASSGAVQTALQIVFGVIGGLALLMITISGLRYILSAGDPQKTKQAKDGIIYSLVGLAVALAAEAIVGFTIGSL